MIFCIFQERAECVFIVDQHADGERRLCQCFRQRSARLGLFVIPVVARRIIYMMLELLATGLSASAPIYFKDFCFQ